jgi:hypothetical protein
LPELLSFKLKQVLEDPQKISNMKKNAQALAKPFAAANVIKVSLSLVNPHDIVSHECEGSMKRAEIVVRKLDESHIEDALRLLCTCYLYHPAMLYLFPEDLEKRHAFSRIWFASYLARCYKYGQVYGAWSKDKLVDVAYWMPYDCPQITNFADLVAGLTEAELERLETTRRQKDSAFEERQDTTLLIPWGGIGILGSSSRQKEELLSALLEQINEKKTSCCFVAHSPNEKKLAKMLGFKLVKEIIEPFPFWAMLIKKQHPGSSIAGVVKRVLKK